MEACMMHVWNGKSRKGRREDRKMEGKEERRKGLRK